MLFKGRQLRPDDEGHNNYAVAAGNEILYNWTKQCARLLLQWRSHTNASTFVLCVRPTIRHNYCTAIRRRIVVSCKERKASLRIDHTVCLVQMAYLA